MIEITPGWALHVERGPEWLFIRVEAPPHHDFDTPPLAEALWAQLQSHFTYRVVVELQDVPLLDSYLVGQLVLLHKRIHAHGGVLRVCGLSEHNQRVLRDCQLGGRLPHYCSREEAIWGTLHRPMQPR